MCRILSHKDTELYMKVVFQALGLKDIKYIEIHIITAILWFKHYIMFPYYFFFHLGWRVGSDSVVSDFSCCI